MATMEEQIMDIAVNTITPVLEGSIVLAGEYSKACGRDYISSQDVKYAMRFCARNMVGKQMGTLFPELEEESDDDSDVEIVDENPDDFTRYQGDNELFLRVNECYDTWDNWEPTNVIEFMLKDAVNKNE
jgi:hypothetical protein